MRLPAILIFFCSICIAQNRDKVIEKYIDKYSSMIDVNPDLSFKHMKIAYAESVKLKNDTLISRTLYNIGMYHYSFRGNKDIAKPYLYKALDYAKKVKFHKIICYTYNQLGMIAAEENQFDKALKIYIDGLKISEQKEFFGMKSNILQNIGNLYLVHEDTLNATKYFDDNITNAKEHQLNMHLAKAYDTMGVLYGFKDEKKAILFYEKALIAAKEGNDYYTLFNTHINMCDMYLRNKKIFNLNKAYYHLKKAEKNQAKLQDKALYFYTNFNYGNYYFEKKDYDNALHYFNKALHSSQKGILSREILHLHEAIESVYLKQKDYKKAFYQKERFNQIKDSFYTIEKNKAFSEIEVKYDVEKKNLKIKILTQEKEFQKSRKRIIIIVSSIVLFFLILVVFFLRNKIVLTKKINKSEKLLQLNKITKLEQENELKRVLGIIEGQDKERNRLSKEIHDGIGATMAGIKMQLSHVNKTLKNEDVNEVIEKMSNAFAELRLISHNLNISLNTYNDLELLLKNLIDEYHKRNEFVIELLVYPTNALNQLEVTIRHNIYRIIQELLANISKHAKAKKVLITFTLHEESLNIIIEDNGIGFVSNGNEGIGLKNIKQRIEDIKGEIVIESISDRGTTVIIDLPIVFYAYKN